MNTKFLREIDALQPPMADWDKVIKALSLYFPDESFYFDSDRHELRIGHTICIQPSWATLKDQFCLLDSEGKGWCRTGENDAYVEVEGVVESWKVGWVQPVEKNNFAWRMVPTCFYTDDDLFANLPILKSTVESFWDMMGDYNVKEPESDDDVVGLAWMGMD